MKFGWHRHILFFLIAVSLPPLTAAVELGDEQVYSFLNEPFLAEIELEDWQDVGLGNIQVELGSRFDFESFGIPYMPELEDLDFAIETAGEGGDGRAYILVTGRNPLKEPYLDFLIKARWSGGMIVREYVVLLDIPDLDPEPARKLPQPVLSDTSADNASETPGQAARDARNNSQSSASSENLETANSQAVDNQLSESDEATEPEIISQVFTPDDSDDPVGRTSNTSVPADSVQAEQPVRIVQAEPETVVQQSSVTAVAEAGLAGTSPAEEQSAELETPIVSEPVTRSEPLPEPQTSTNTRPEPEVLSEPEGIEPELQVPVVENRAGSTQTQTDNVTETQPALSQARQQGQADNSSMQAASGSIPDRYRVMPGDTLWGIADEYRQSGTDISIYQAMLGIYASNMDAFVNRNFTLLKANQNLVIPDSREMARFSSTDALAIINELTENGQARVDALRQGLPLPEFTDFPVLLAENSGAISENTIQQSTPETEVLPEIRRLPLEEPPVPAENALLTPVSSQASLPVLTEEADLPEAETSLPVRRIPVIPDSRNSADLQVSDDNTGMGQAEAAGTNNSAAQAQEMNANQNDNLSASEQEEIARLENLLADRQAEIFALEEQMQNMQVHLSETENSLQRLTERLEEQNAMTETVQGTVTTLTEGGPAVEAAPPAGLLISPFVLRLLAGTVVVLLLAGVWVYWRKSKLAAASEWDGLDDLEVPDTGTAEDMDTGQVGQAGTVSSIAAAEAQSSVSQQSTTADQGNEGEDIVSTRGHKQVSAKADEPHFSAYDEFDDDFWGEDQLFTEMVTPEEKHPSADDNRANQHREPADLSPVENLELEGLDLDELDDSPEQYSGSETDSRIPEADIRNYSPDRGKSSQREYSVSGQESQKTNNLDDIMLEINLEVSDQPLADDQDKNDTDVADLQLPPKRSDHKPH